MEKKDGVDAVFFVAVFPFNGFLWMFTPISWVISYKPYITAEIYRSNWIRGCKGQKRNQIDSLQQDLYIYIYMEYPSLLYLFRMIAPAPLSKSCNV